MSNKNNVLELLPSEIKYFIKNAWHNRHVKTRPIFILGHKGVGKSEIVRQVAAELAVESKKAVECKIVNLQFCEPPDFLGLPYIDEEKMTRHARPDLLPADGFGIYFLDEANRCGRDNRAGLLTLIQDREVNGHKLGADWIIVLAGNPSDESGMYETMEFDAALEDRISKVEFKGDVQEFLKYMIEKYGQADSVIRWAMNHPDVVDFGGKTRTSPRGLEYLIRRVQIEGGYKSKNLFNVAALEVGVDGAVALTKFLSDEDILRAEDVMAGVTRKIKEKTMEFVKAGRADVINEVISGIVEIITTKMNEKATPAADLRVFLRPAILFLELLPADFLASFILLLGDKLTVSGSEDGNARFCKLLDVFNKDFPGFEGRLESVRMEEKGVK